MIITEHLWYSGHMIRGQGNTLTSAFSFYPEPSGSKWRPKKPEGWMLGTVGTQTHMGSDTEGVTAKLLGCNDSGWPRQVEAGGAKKWPGAGT